MEQSESRTVQVYLQDGIFSYGRKNFPTVTVAGTKYVIWSSVKQAYNLHRCPSDYLAIRPYNILRVVYNDKNNSCVGKIAGRWLVPVQHFREMVTLFINYINISNDQVSQIPDHIDGDENSCGKGKITIKSESVNEGEVPQVEKVNEEHTLVHELDGDTVEYIIINGPRGNKRQNLKSSTEDLESESKKPKQSKFISLYDDL